jgi:cytochrome c biogenesis protein CcdA
MNYPMQMQSQNQTLATVSLVLGILSLFSLCCWGGIPFGAAAVITGVLAKNKEKSDPNAYGGGGMALAGIITGAVALLIGFGILILAIIGNIS